MTHGFTVKLSSGVETKKFSIISGMELFVVVGNNETLLPLLDVSCKATFI